MNLLLFLSCIVAAYAHGNCGGDCLKACRSCKALINDGADGVNGTSPFLVGARHRGDCHQLVCKDHDKGAVLIVEGHQYSKLVCFQGKWHFGYPDFLEETDSGMCLTPGNMTCDVDASVKFEENFKCVCNPPFVDVSEEFAEDGGQFCTNCDNKKLNIILLVDNSGSMDAVKSYVWSFATTLIKFLKVKPTGNRIALVSSSFSYEIVIDWANPASTDESALMRAVQMIMPDGQSNLASGLEAVKAALVQPSHDNDSEEHKLVVISDGSVKHSHPQLNDITVAANNLEALGVETFVVATNNIYKEKQYAIANGVTANVFEVLEGNDILPIANKLQKRLCA